MKYRGRTDIIDSILESVANGDGVKTRIMFHSYLSYSQLKEYLALLQLRKLIEFDETSGRFVLTEKGVQFRDAYGKISELLPSADARNEVSKVQGKI